MSSLIRHSRKPLSITPIICEQLPCQRRGLTGFTYARYLVPWLCDFQGEAVFLDGDIVVTADIEELFDLGSVNDAAVSVCSHVQQFEWPSVMYFDCARCEVLTPQYVSHPEAKLPLGWTDRLGNLPPRWNFCVGYQEKPDPLNDEPPSLIHYTMGVPIFRELRHCDYAEVWYEEYRQMLSTCSWLELMGQSVHTKHVMKALPKTNGEYLCL